MLISKFYRSLRPIKANLTRNLINPICWEKKQQFLKNHRQKNIRPISSPEGRISTNSKTDVRTAIGLYILAIFLNSVTLFTAVPCDVTSH